MSDKLNESLNEQIKAFNDVAAAETARLKVVVEVTSPQMLTVMRKGGKSGYAKHAFLGGEYLVFSRIYYGKKNTPIIVFTPSKPNSDYISVEIPLNQIDKCTDFTSSYLPFLIQLGFMSFEDMWLAYHNAATETVKEQQITSGATTYGDAWGYWG